VRLWCEDNGVGIDEKAAGRLSASFSGCIRRATMKGLASAWAIVRRAVERMGAPSVVEFRAERRQPLLGRLNQRFEQSLIPLRKRRSQAGCEMHLGVCSRNR